VRLALSNSFGFGGNNASLVLAKPQADQRTRSKSVDSAEPLYALAWACATGTGGTAASLARLRGGLSCAGRVPVRDLTGGLLPRALRRTKRLPLLALGLAQELAQPLANAPAQEVYLGTGWGCLSETHDFLQALYDSADELASPIDFMGSVHNAPAGRLAQHLGATGANLTTSAGAVSWLHALYAASLLTGREPALVLGLDEHHPVLTPLLDPDAARDRAADGGGALLVARRREPGAVALRPMLLGRGPLGAQLEALQRQVRDGRLAGRWAWLLLDAPAWQEVAAVELASQLREAMAPSGQVADCRALTGSFASAGAVAAVLACDLARNPSGTPGPVLVLSLDGEATALEVEP
jgi:3-oxoacyl-[acyl-carrier-protein] synthase-1/3-oxoacyl-[acyl-carrier-protein] synthase II